MTKMQLPTVERTTNLRPTGADMAVPAAAKVMPVAPVNPPVAASQPQASVVNEINPEVQAKASAEAAAQVSQPDPLQGGAKADTSHKDWTQAAPKPKQQEEQPKEPLTQMLIDHVKTLWQLSARAVDLMAHANQHQNPVQVQNTSESRNQMPSAVPGILAKESLTYSPSKIPKMEKAE